MSRKPKAKFPGNISVIMPAYNAATWLPKSIPLIAEELKKANVSNAEIIVVDDGSSDGTSLTAKSLKLDYPLRVVKQDNAGRFIARSNGVKVAKYDYVLFVDTRIYIGKGGLGFIGGKLTQSKEKSVWTSHVVIDRTSNIYARFWEALTFIAWRKYFSNPREYSYGLKEFDYYPKGTTCFFVPKKVIAEANAWFATQTKNDKASNDDTLLIRRIAETNTINISPDFYCTYHARTNLRQYCKHVYHRGKVFVDGFLRHDGNRFFLPLVGFLVISILLPVTLLIKPNLIIPTLILGVALWGAELSLAVVLGVPKKDALSLFTLSPLFAVIYGAGIWAAVLEIYVYSKVTRYKSV